jgi:Trk K+ transport system NAD-binding subunit
LGEPALCTLALLSDSPAHPEGEDTVEGVRLLPDDTAVREADGVHGRVVLEAVTRRPEPPTGTRARRRQRRRRGGFALRELLPSQLWYALAGLLALQGVFAVVDWWVIGGPFPHAGYLALLDILNINEPAIGESFSRQLLQVLSGITGMALLPVLFAVVLQTLGAFRTVSALRLPPRGLSGHVVLVGLGRVGSRTLDLLSSLDIDVVCVERDPGARGVALARSRRIPVVIGDATQEGVLEAAKIGRSRALLALTSDDGTNLEAVLYAREAKPELRVVMRLFDDNFASTLYNTLRDSYPHATTRSRSVSTLCAPAFAVAMMGRQILGSIPVERQVLLFATVEVRGQGELEGRTVREAFRPGEWRPVALDHEPEPVWDLDPDYVLKPDDRVLLAATRHGLARLLR